MTDREFFEQYNKDVYRTCYYMLRNASDAEDVCQEVFMKALNSGWQQVEYLKTWLMRITVNHCLNHIRASKTRRMKEAMLTLFQRDKAAPSTLTLVEQQETKDEWKRRMDRLPDKIKVVVMLRFTNDLPLADIAEVLDIPLGTVKSRLNRGLKLMKNMMDELDEEELPLGHTAKKQTIRGKDGAEYEQAGTRGESSCTATGR
ncbi:RNA polymerase sigma factor [Paenibacillus sp. DMB20]|uniref:RNA polymerase sigma factor n=1 Tax=Paenibacillus sp. DMB20 TaxID=1642570 RepID=UPI000627D63B|nr:RNA polymerase sigma factor [Paenibacillus sp. DMB20]KKO53918.1 DNA-directed RNA polymerase subunit sigma [Paenibacillus sp. DMB20]